MTDSVLVLRVLPIGPVARIDTNSEPLQYRVGAPAL